MRVQGVQLTRAQSLGRFGVYQTGSKPIPSLGLVFLPEGTDVRLTIYVILLRTYVVENFVTLQSAWTNVLTTEII